MLMLAFRSVASVYSTLFTVIPAPNVAVLRLLKLEYWPIRWTFRF